VEVCDEVDNDCDGDTDEGLTTTYYLDADEDGYGNPSRKQDACALPDGYTTTPATATTRSPWPGPARRRSVTTPTTTATAPPTRA
jgi:hypothetical protein